MARAKNKKLANPAAVAAVAKAAPEAKKTIKKVNEDTKGGVSWLLLGGAAVLGFIILKTVNNASKVGDVVGGAADAASSALDQLTDIINDPNLDASNTDVSGIDLEPTISDLEAQNRAIALLEAMDRFGTDFTRVKASLTGINHADYVLISEKFGKPRYDGMGSSFWAPKRNLSYWIVAELDNSELDQIRNLLPGLF